VGCAVRHRDELSIIASSPWYSIQLDNTAPQGEVAELEGILVSNTYGVIGKELEVEATVKGFGSDADAGYDLTEYPISGVRMKAYVSLWLCRAGTGIENKLNG
jgi:hypothetical protein